MEYIHYIQGEAWTDPAIYEREAVKPCIHNRRWQAKLGRSEDMLPLKILKLRSLRSARFKKDKALPLFD